MGTFTDVKARYEAEMKVTGADDVARGFGKVEKSALGAADGMGVLARQHDVGEKSITRIGSKLAVYERQQLSPVDKALREVERGERLVEQARRDGIAVTDGMLAAVENARAKYEKLTASLNDNAAAYQRISAIMSQFGGMTDPTNMTAKLTASIKAQTAALASEADKAGAAINSKLVAGMSGSGGMTDPTSMTRKMSQSANEAAKAAGLARHEWINLSRQGQDVAVSLAGGQSPLTVLMQQGGQIADVFTSSKGGAGAALKEFAAVIGRYALNPVTAIVGAIGTASYAMYRWQQQTDALTVSLNGLGRATGLSVGDVNQIAAKAAAASGISLSNARGLAGQYIGAGVSGGSIGGAIGLIRDFSRKFGMDESGATGVLAGALADPARGAEELARKFGLVSVAQREQINRLSDLGDRSAATAKLIDVLKDRLAKLEDPTWSASRALDGLKVSASNLLDRIARGVLGTGVTDDEFARQARQTAVLGGKLDEALARQLGIDRIASDAALAAREITAQTYAQREAIILEKGRTQALQDTKNATQHLMEAEAERLRLLAEAQRKVDEYARAGVRDRALSAARSPYERGRLQIIQEGDELLRQIPASVRAPQRGASAASGGRGDSGVNDLVAEAVRRGLEPTQQTFEKLMSEGVGSGKFRGRLVRIDEGFGQSTVDVPNINRGAMVKQVQSETAARLEDYAKRQQSDFFLRSNQDLEAQNRLLDANIESFGKSTGEVERARKAAELLSQAKQQGLPITAEMNQKIAEEAARYGDLATRVEEASRKQQEFRDALDIVRSATHDLGESLVNAFRRGESAAEAMRGVLDRLTSKLLDKTLDVGIDALLGKMGTAQTGVAGGLLGGVGGIGSLVGTIASMFKFENGGVMTSRGPLPLHTYASGGIANTPQMALFGEGRRPEAFVPLPDGRNIPVRMNGQQGQAKVTVNNYSGASVDARQLSDGEILVVVGKMVDQKMKSQVPGIIANSQKRAM